MTLSMTQLRSETLEGLGIDADDLDPSGSANLDLLINRSWWDVIDRFDFKEKEQVTTFATVAGTRSYSLQTILGSQIFESVRNVSILDSTDLFHTDLDPISINWYEDNYNEQTTLRAKPTKYIHDGGNLFLYQTPDAIYTVTLWYQFILSDLTAGTPSIPQAWHESILYGAIARGFRRARDFNSAKEMEQEQELQFAKRSTTQAKDDKEQKTVGVMIMRNPYSVNH